MGLARAAASIGAGLVFAATSHAVIGMADAAASLRLLVMAGGGW
jgi:hypothetical protein